MLVCSGVVDCLKASQSARLPLSRSFGSRGQAFLEGFWSTFWSFQISDFSSNLSHPVHETYSEPSGLTVVSFLGSLIGLPSSLPFQDLFIGVLDKMSAFSLYLAGESGKRRSLLCSWEHES